MTIFLKPNLNKSNKENLYWQLSTNPSKEPIGLMHVDGVITENIDHQTNYIIHCLNNENIFTFKYTPQKNDQLILVLDSKDEKIFHYNGTEWELEFPLGAIYYYEFGLVIEGSIEYEKGFF
jgi:hypothetical protein